jgi:predicted transcriptional regulator
MTINRHTVEIDAETDVRLRQMAVERGQDVSAVLADAIALLDAIGLAGPDVAEDRRRLDAYRQSGLGVPLSDVKDWVASWARADELRRPLPRKTG